MLHATEAVIPKNLRSTIPKEERHQLASRYYDIFMQQYHDQTQKQHDSQTPKGDGPDVPGRPGQNSPLSLALEDKYPAAAVSVFSSLQRCTSTGTPTRETASLGGRSETVRFTTQPALSICRWERCELIQDREEDVIVYIR